VSPAVAARCAQTRLRLVREVSEKPGFKAVLLEVMDADDAPGKHPKGSPLWAWACGSREARLNAERDPARRSALAAACLIAGAMAGTEVLPLRWRVSA
jgi:hypothetical protein